MNEMLRGIDPVKPVAPYLGGKNRLANTVIKRLQEIPHTTYVEPFVGMGGVFFRRPFEARCEVINDLNRDIANFFRILQQHYVPLMDILRWQLTTRADFDRLLATDGEQLTDLQRAARFLYLQRTAFGGKINGKTFGVSLRTARFDVQRLGPLLEEVHARLSRATIECLPWQNLIARYDRPETLFYLDPPYWGCEDYYNAAFDRTQFAEMAALLKTIRGRFVLSLNDHPDVRQTFAGFDVTDVQVAYSIAKERRDKAPFREVLISN